uniref:G-protein coupled receptors family 1 profile domain-containing protein n=1 Tax=Sinocyclocheilus rhinocerous TaxID=307959 RepID=A0A673HIE1_9TELE
MASYIVWVILISGVIPFFTSNSQKHPCDKGYFLCSENGSEFCLAYLSASVHRFLTITMMQEDNLTTNVSCQIHDGILSPFLPIGYIIICCIGLLCNTVTLYIFFLRRQTDSSMTVYMRHLALADTLLVMCLPLRVYYHNKKGPFYLCKVPVCFHFHSKGPVGGTINLTTVVLFLVFYVAFLCFYVKITKKLKTMSMGNGDPKAQSHKKRVIMKIFLVPAIFTLCFLPYHAIRIPYVLAQMNSALLLSALNSCLDPIIYYFLSSEYRKTILHIFDEFRELSDPPIDSSVITTIKVQKRSKEICKIIHVTSRVQP